MGDALEPTAPAARALTDEVLRALSLSREALSHAAQTCRYHGREYERAGMRYGEPTCDSCKQPWRVDRALSVIRGLEVFRG